MLARVVVSWGLIVFMAAGPLWAQSVDAGFELRGLAGASREVQDSEAAVTRHSAGVAFFFRDWRLQYTEDHFTWDEADQLVSDTQTPWQRLHTLGADWSHRERFNDRWGWFARLGATASFEEEIDRSVQGSAGGGLNYAFSSQWSLSFGAGTVVHPLRWRVLPLASLNFRPQSTSGWTARIGVPRTAITYRWNAGWSLGADLQRHNRFSRLADDNELVPSGYAEIEDWSLGPVLGWQGEKGWRLTCSPRYHFGTDYTVYGPDGDKKHTWETDTGWSIQAGIRYQLQP